jgi:hypothetical protein
MKLILIKKNILLEGKLKQIFFMILIKYLNYIYFFFLKKYKILYFFIGILETKIKFPHIK